MSGSSRHDYANRSTELQMPQIHSTGSGPFYVLVGPNASGKTTFLDVVGFLGKLVAEGPEAAVVKKRSTSRILFGDEVATVSS